MRAYTMICTAGWILMTFNAPRSAPAAEPWSPFALGDLSGLAEPIGSASPSDSSLDLEISALYSAPFSAAVTTSAAATGAFAVSGRSYFTAKAGPMWFFGDLDKLHTGVNLDIAYGFHILPFFAIELQGGYFHGEESNGSTDTKVWGVPAVVNARVTLPLLLFDVYGGMGLGAYYINLDLDGAQSGHDDDVVFGGDIFAGLGFGLGPVLVGVEAKYFATTKANLPGDDPRLRAFAAMVTVGLSF